MGIDLPSDKQEYKWIYSIEYKLHIVKIIYSENNTFRLEDFNLKNLQNYIYQISTIGHRLFKIRIHICTLICRTI